MTIGPDLPEAVTAFKRFGFGARPGDLNAAAGDPRGFLLDELWTASVALIGDPRRRPGPRPCRPITSRCSKAEARMNALSMARCRQPPKPGRRSSPVHGAGEA